MIIVTVNCSAVFAHDNETFTFGNYSIIINESTELAENKELAEKVYNYHVNSISFNNETSTYGLMCTLFGHDIESTRASVIEHKVDVYEPRCYMTFYTIETCSRCDYENIYSTGSTYTYCCPEE